MHWQDPPAPNEMTWQDARDYCIGLVFDGHSDWRLPSIEDLRTLVIGCEAVETGGSCRASSSCTDTDCLKGCLCDEFSTMESCWASDALTNECRTYWSESVRECNPPGCALVLEFFRAWIMVMGTDDFASVRCVR